METFKFKHPRRVYLYALLSFLMCMLGASTMSAGSRTPRNPIVKLISGPTYSNNGTEVTLKLWMYNYDGDNAYFTGNVMLRIDDKDACTLNNMWSLISNVYHKDEDKIKNYENRGNVGSQGIIKLDGVNVGTAQFCNAQRNQKCPYNSNTGETKWTTIELKLSFNNSFSYRRHTVSVNGNWRDRCDDSKYNDKIWDLQNTLHGFVYPTNLEISKFRNDVLFTWGMSGWQDSENIKGKWVLYKKENGTSVKQAEVTDPTTQGSITIAAKNFRCLATYYFTFLPNGFSETATISGLTVSKSRGSHTTLDGVCRYCQHGIFSYTTADGKIVNNISNPDQFGANIVAHSVVDGKCVIEFDAPITKIPANAFYNKNSLTGDLVIPNSVTEIGEHAFHGCTGLNGTLTLSSKLGKIGQYAFYGCTGFTGSLKLPSSVTNIGSSAFSGCKSFTKLELSNALSAIPEYAFRGCEGLSGSLVIPDGVKEIGASAFSGCTGFNGTLTLSSKLGKIGENAFYGCTGFTGSLKLPSSLTDIGIAAFMNCKYFTKLELSNALSAIPESAFKGCEGLSGSLVIPNSVTEIGNHAFNNCTGFNGTLTLSNKLETIGESAFNGCSGFRGSLTLPSSVTTIGKSAFRTCCSFTKLELPNTLSVIPTQAFMLCRSLSGELVIPASVTEIGNNAFSDCLNLNAVTGQVTLPKSLEKIGYYVFGNTNNIKTVNFQSLPEGISGFLGQKKKAVSLSDDSYISDKASGTVNEISYTRQMSNNWGTLVLPYSLTLTGSEPYHLYSIDNMTGEELVLKQLEGTVAAGTPCVVKRKGSEAELTFGSNIAKLNMERVAQDVGGMKFRGTYWTEDVNSGYVISKNSFWNVEELKGSTSVNGVKVNPFRAWLDGTSANAPAQLSMRIDGSTTGIDAIDALNDAEAEYYDLSGKRLNEPQKGVNIVRMKSGKTKKIIIK
ncbi:leucine-rich repeat domain-containing protein [Prevotella merdae]|uniref:leucine-rich repeat domain-containing protein n=1 Tax=Prevotella merdae TaxID=2079531 RepID=UPI000D104097|nr:leucine-rich repeat domain-containing protein [Prevotella merdae]